MRELRPGVWHWTAPHPQWTADQPWPHEVSSYAIDDGSRVLLFDPLAVPEELLETEVVARLEVAAWSTSAAGCRSPTGCART
jgi:hypothetical protein